MHRIYLIDIRWDLCNGVGGISIGVSGGDVSGGAGVY